MSKQAVSHSKWPSHFKPGVVRTGFGGGRLSSYCLALEAWRRGLEVTLLGPNATDLSITDGYTTVRLNHSRSGNPKSKAFATALNKYRTSEALRAHGVPVPESRLVNTAEMDYAQVLEAAETIGFPVVLKPLRGTMGRGVFANITSAEQLKDSYEQLTDNLKTSTILLERHHFGQDARVVVVGEKYIAACTRIPANVTGDGHSTVRELISAKNATRRRNPFLAGGLITPDHEVRAMINRSSHTLDSVPGHGESLRLREKSNGSAGGDVLDVTETLPDHIKQAAVEAVKAIPGLRTAGVDLLWDEYHKPDNRDTTNGFVIIEMNSRPHIGLNMYPNYGNGRDLPKAIIDDHFPASNRRQTGSFDNLTFDFNAAGSPITSNIINQSLLAPLPEHGYPVRRRYSIPSGLSIKSQTKRSLVSLARQAGIVFKIQLSGGKPRVTLGAETAASADQFLQTLADKLGESPTLMPKWNGPLYVGFSFS